jgi:hypothetical protein
MFLWTGDSSCPLPRTGGTATLPNAEKSADVKNDLIRHGAEKCQFELAIPNTTIPNVMV